MGAWFRKVRMHVLLTVHCHMKRSVLNRYGGCSHRSSYTARAGIIQMACSHATCKTCSTCNTCSSSSRKRANKGVKKRVTLLTRSTTLLGRSRLSSGLRNYLTVRTVRAPVDTSVGSPQVCCR